MIEVSAFVRSPPFTEKRDEVDRLDFFPYSARTLFPSQPHSRYKLGSRPWSLIVVSSERHTPICCRRLGFETDEGDAAFVRFKIEALLKPEGVDEIT